jgi:hypothetical protein
VCSQYCFTCRPLHTAAMCFSTQIVLLLTQHPASAHCRLTTGEMLVSPSKVIFADEISTGLDSSTTFQIIQNLSHYAHKRKVRRQQNDLLTKGRKAYVTIHQQSALLASPVFTNSVWYSVMMCRCVLCRRPSWLRCCSPLQVQLPA